MHGSSEACGHAGPHLPSGPRATSSRDALARGYRLGFIGSGDRHDGHPGLVQLAGPHGGLAALIGAEPTRESILRDAPRAARLRHERAAHLPPRRAGRRSDGLDPRGCRDPDRPDDAGPRARTAGTAVIDRDRRRPRAHRRAGRGRALGRRRRARSGRAGATSLASPPATTSTSGSSSRTAEPRGRARSTRSDLVVRARAHGGTVAAAREAG